MERIRKTLIHCLIIIFSCAYLMFFSAIYLSPNSCIEDSMKGLYFYPSYIVDYVKNPTGRTYLLVTPDSNYIALHDTDQIFGILWKPGSGATRMNMQLEEEPIKFQLTQTKDFIALAVRRKSDSFHSIQLIFTDGTTQWINQWDKDYPEYSLIGFETAENFDYFFQWTAYDSNNNPMLTGNYPS